jgi:hypothetical protein
MGGPALGQFAYGHERAASFWQAFYRIILPPWPRRPTILCFLYSWSDFFFALILTRTEAMTAPVAVVNFMNYEGWEWGKFAAGGTMVMLPVLFFSILVRKFLVHGLAAGALKGGRWRQQRARPPAPATHSRSDRGRHAVSAQLPRREFSLFIKAVRNSTMSRNRPAWQHTSPRFALRPAAWRPRATSASRPIGTTRG